MSYSIFLFTIFFISYNEIVKFKKFFFFYSDNEKVSEIYQFRECMKFGKIIKYFECSSNF